MAKMICKMCGTECEKKIKIQKYCVICSKKAASNRARKWAANNKNKLKQYYLKNKDKLKEREKEYCLKNREKVRARKRAYYLRNREKYNVSRRKYYLKNKEKMRKMHHNFYLRNKEKCRSWCRRYWQKNSEKIIFKQRLYRKGVKMNKNTVKYLRLSIEDLLDKVARTKHFDKVCNIFLKAVEDALKLLPKDVFQKMALNKEDKEQVISDEKELKKEKAVVKEVPQICLTGVIGVQNKKVMSKFKERKNGKA